MTKQINLVINDKGGVGKRFFATNFVQYLKFAALIIAPLTAIRKLHVQALPPESNFINLEHGARSTGCSSLLRARSARD